MPPWTYYGRKGPSSWGKLDPAYSACSKGKQQSPIDIRGAKRNPALQPIEFHYISGPVTLVNTGITIRVDVTPGGYIVFNGVRYDLVEFHFHHPAEDLVDGKLSDIQIDLVHKNAAGQKAIIGVRLNEGRVNGVARDAVAKPSRNIGSQGDDSGSLQSTWTSARRPQLLELHGFDHRSSMYRGSAVDRHAKSYRARARPATKPSLDSIPTTHALWNPPTEEKSRRANKDQIQYPL